MVYSNSKNVGLIWIVSIVLAFLIGLYVPKSFHLLGGGIPLASQTVATAPQPSDAQTVANPGSQVPPTAKSSGRQVNISKRIINADYAAKSAVGGGQVNALSATTLQGTPAWVIDILNHGKLSRVVVRQSDDAVLSKQALN